MSFTLAIVGRPNVGKSTLFNRLTGRRLAIVDDRPGVTRDRKEGVAQIGPLTFTAIDTAGLEEAKAGSLAWRMTEQTKEAIRVADAVLMLVDARSGITPMDRHFAKLIRTLKKPVALAVNKAEGKEAAAALAEAHGLGLGEPVAISAEHNEGMAELYAALAEFEKESPIAASETPDHAIENAILSLAIVGRPNVGKSTLVNCLLGQDRMLTGPEAGITRDAVAVNCRYGGRLIRLVDTAGMRKQASVEDTVEQRSVEASVQAMRQAQVVVLVLDAEQPLEQQDNKIAALAEQEGRAVVIAINKWDLVEEKPAFLKAFRQRLDYVLPQLRGVAVVPISAKDETHIGKLLAACDGAARVWNRKVPTGELNRWLESALEQHTAPLVDGRRLKIRYITQKSTRPPSFIVFANLSDIPDHYLRYLIGSLREAFDLPGTPIRIKIRTGKNPYAGKTSSRKKKGAVPDN